jgi:hypothetical protein
MAFAGLRRRIRGWPKDMALGFFKSEWGLLQTEPIPKPTDRPSLDSILTAASAREGYMTPDTIEPRIERASNSFVFKFADMKLDYSLLEGMLLIGHFPEKAPERYQYTFFDMRWPKKEVMAAFERWLDGTLKERAAAGLKQSRPDTRRRLTELIEYLKVYDLRKAGETYATIGRIIWGTAFGDLDKKAGEYYKKGERLVLNPPLKPSVTRKLASREVASKPE